MCPKAAGANVKYAYLDHDTDRQNLAPPVLNQWYTVFHAYDVRLIWCQINQSNTEAAAKDIETKWTIDGISYFKAFSMPSGVRHWCYRDHNPSAGGTAGLVIVAVEYNAGMFVDKRGQDFKVEVRITSALGTAQTLICDCVRETLEQT
jgi:hypothetical protein